MFKMCGVSLIYDLVLWFYTVSNCFIIFSRCVCGVFVMTVVCAWKQHSKFVESGNR